MKRGGDTKKEKEETVSANPEKEGKINLNSSE